MTNDCKTCPVSTGTHKPAEAVHQIDEPQADALLELAAYRFTVENREARIAELESQLAAAPQAVQAAVPETREALAKRLIGDVKVADAIAKAACQRVAELPDRDSPADWPDAMLVTGDELHMIVRETVIAAQATPAHPAEGVHVQVVELEVDDLIDRLLNAQQDLNLAANVHMDQSIASASTLLDEVEIALRTLAATHPTQQGLDAPTLNDAWKARLLDGAPLARDKYGCAHHHALPNLHEGARTHKFFEALGIELICRMAEDEMDSDAYEAMTEHGFTEDGPNYNAWTPAKPEGDGWCLVAVFDTEDGPACWWVRAAQAKQGEQP